MSSSVTESPATLVVGSKYSASTSLSSMLYTPANSTGPTLVSTPLGSYENDSGIKDWLIFEEYREEVPLGEGSVEKPRNTGEKTQREQEGRTESQAREEIGDEVLGGPSRLGSHEEPAREEEMEPEWCQGIDEEEKKRREINEGTVEVEVAAAMPPDLTRQIEFGEKIDATGSYADVCKGVLDDGSSKKQVCSIFKYKSEANNQLPQVAIKVLRPNVKPKKLKKVSSVRFLMHGWLCLRITLIYSSAAGTRDAIMAKTRSSERSSTIWDNI